jgi:hypothetical protein
MPFGEYHTNLEALEAYGMQIAKTFKGISCSICTCPHCGQIAVKLALPGTNDSFVDAVHEEGSSKFYPARYCLKDVTGKYVVLGQLQGMHHTKWLPDNVEAPKPEPVGPRICTCDYDTVIRIIGCQCGGV